MAQFTYETRKKISDEWVKQTLERAGHLSPREKRIISEMSYYSVSEKDSDWISERLSDGAYQILSELYKKELAGLVKACVEEPLRDEFYEALDAMNQYQMTAGWYRRSLRSSGYQAFAQKSLLLIRAYARLRFYGKPLELVLTGQIDPELYDHARTDSWNYAPMLAARIDRGGKEGAAIVQAVKDILLGENNTVMISRELISGIVMSRSQELYQVLGDFLLAARLQEGARQAVCETMDAGRPEAFLHLFQVIEDHNLIRYSAVKRAVSTWIGIFDENNVDRITEKLVRLMGQCLRNQEFCEEQLQTNDSIAISCGLWAKGFYNAMDAIEAVQKLVKDGTKNQKMTASYFNNTLQLSRLKMKAAKEVIMTQSDDIELVACFMPGFLEDVFTDLFHLLRDDEKGRHYSFFEIKAKKPALKDVTARFESEEEARTIYGKLREILKKLPKKGIDLNPCIFPWYRVTMVPSDLIKRMCLIAWMLQDEACLEEVAPLIPQLGQGETYGAAIRAVAARVILYKPKSPVKKKVLFELLHNPEEYTMRSAFQLVDTMELEPEDYAEIEKNLKYKKGREGTLAILRKQDAKQLTACIGRLLQTNSEECHMGALDLALELKKNSPEEFQGVKPLLSALSEPTGKEKVLLAELTEESSEAQDILQKKGYGLYDPEANWVIPEITVDAGKAATLFQYTEKDYIRVLEALNTLIEKNTQLEYKTAWGTEMLLGNKLERTTYAYESQNSCILDQYPFRELWERFYQEEIRNPQLLLELQLYQQCRQRKELYETNIGLYKKIFGSGLIKKPPFKKMIEGLRYGVQVRTVLDVLDQYYVPKELKATWGLVGMAKFLEVIEDRELLFDLKEKRYDGEITLYTMRTVELPVYSQFLAWLDLASAQDWENVFALKFRLEETYGRVKGKEKSLYFYKNKDCYLKLADFVQCYTRGLWDKPLFYKAVLEYLNFSSILGPASTVEQKGSLSSREARPHELYAFFGPGVLEPVDGKYRFDDQTAELPAMKLAHEIYRDTVPLVLKVELKRGEQPTPFSEGISSIHIVYGIDVMVQILAALGKDTLARGYYYSNSNATDRKRTLSHLLKVCYPRPEETVEDLKKALKGTDITKKRLVELCMYAQQWIPLIEEYLKIPGFQSGCYYFIAHTSEGLDDFTTSMVAKYTPLSPEELRDGAFDIQWFFEAYEKIGEKFFQLLYDAAKYSSNGAACTRARKYADAALGKVEEELLKQEISKKRNKDLLMSLGLLPLSKGEKKKEKEMLERYQFIQAFRKESRQFGSQRRASEGRAADLALRNLSVNAGFTDVMRLTLRMESKMVEAFSGYFDWKPLEEAVSVSIQVDEDGKSRMLCKKGEKVVESIPTKYKKSEIVKELQGVNKQLKEQYARTRQMMEQAMEDRSPFKAWELLELRKNPVIKPILEGLVMKVDTPSVIMGFLSEDGLTDCHGTLQEVSPDMEMLIAHPYDLYEAGCWHEYQRHLFEKQIRQPFKQVFRELYVKLQEELDKEHSLMFAGNQIQPQRTVGALRSRRWVADYEDGLQKIYYKENIVAQIYAMADWFSPSDIEAPALEWVIFYDRKTFKPKKIQEIPDIVYSEVMRDVDLAVSVAHAGGVDPETSHSTIEMRKAIARCSLELFKIKNVRLEGNHAVIDGKLGQYTIHLGSGVVHQMGNSMLFVVPVHSQHRGRLFLPFVDEDPKTAEIMSKIVLFAEDTKIRDPQILSQIR